MMHLAKSSRAAATRMIWLTGSALGICLLMIGGPHRS